MGEDEEGHFGPRASSIKAMWGWCLWETLNTEIPLGVEDTRLEMWAKKVLWAGVTSCASLRAHHFHKACPKMKTPNLQSFRTCSKLAIKWFSLIFTTLHDGFYYLCFTSRESLTPKSQGHFSKHWQSQDSN